MDISPDVMDAKLKPDWFGLIARARLPLPQGRWKVTTLSDDGIRVIVNGATVIENWTHHGATADEAIFEVRTDEPVELIVEYFEIYGAAVLDLQLAPAD